MNRTNSKFFVKNLVLGALFLALALVLPFFTGHIPQIGAMLCPMHLPILLLSLIHIFIKASGRSISNRQT